MNSARTKTIKGYEQMAFAKADFLRDWEELRCGRSTGLVYRVHDYSCFSVGPAMTEDKCPAFFVNAGRRCRDRDYKHMTLRSRRHREGDYFLVLSLRNEELIDRFADLCALLDEAAEQSAEKRGEVFLKDQLDRWASLLDKAHRKFTDEEIRGLWGELTVLKKLIGMIGPQKAVEAWKAPKEKAEYEKFDAASQDFSFDDLTVEVKTRYEQADVVTISSLEQLDPVPGQRLFLYVVTLLDAENGKNLSDLISVVHQELDRNGAEMTVKDQFDHLVTLYGFDAMSARETAEKRFESTAENVYDATSEAFPSLRRSKLPPAVSAGRYRLRLSAIADFETELPA